MGKPRRLAAAKDPAEEPLTLKEQAFVAAYLSCWNGTEAMRQIRGGKDSALGVAASTMLRKPRVRAAIAAAIDGKAMTAAEVLLRLSLMASASIGEFMDAAGNIDTRSARARHNMFLVKKLERRTITTGSARNPKVEVIERIELHDPQAALVHLGRWHGLWVDKTEHTGANGGPILVEDVTDIKAELLSRFAQADAASRTLDVPGSTE